MDADPIFAGRFDRKPMKGQDGKNGNLCPLRTE
jgi:hypothetical protein